MLTQFDHSKRVVSLENLKAMCKYISGMCHRYWIEKVTAHRVYVTYSNPNEYPMTIVFPCYPSGDRPEDKENPAVVLDILKVQRDNWDGEGWQAFQGLLDCPPIYRSPQHGGAWVMVNEKGESVVVVKAN